MSCHINLLIEQARELAERLVTSFPASFKGYIRLADTTLNPKVSALALARAISLNPSLLELVSIRLRKLHDTVTWGPLTTAAELDTIPLDLRSLLLRPWPVEIHESTTLWTATVTSRERMLYLGRHELPRFFSWIYPGRLAGMSTPRHEGDIDLLVEMGFTHVLSLTDESPLPEEWFTFKLEHVLIPIRNLGSPTLAEMNYIYERVEEGGRWLIHCGAGVGRAGTVLACLIAMFGKDEGENTTPRLVAKTAITLLRQARPRSLESEAQEKFVAAWVSHRWKVSHDTIRLAEPCTLLYQIGMTRYPTDAILFLIGLPGSGKSWLATAISKRRPKGKTSIISQDESGSRAACERQLAQHHSPDTLIILDRCNPLISDRKEWLKLVDSPVFAIHFDYPRELCEQRIDSRLKHPTIRAGRGGNALAQFVKEMQPPSPEEGFVGIITITSFPAARDAVRRIAGDPPLLKFPRTPHQLDLGASTDDDLVLEGFTVLSGNMTIEEKVDGANLGISLDWDGVIRVQNRSHWISSSEHSQFRSLDRWIEGHSTALRRLLERDDHMPERYILYGEWMIAKHSIHYTSLPAPFLAFDLYDRLEGTFLSRRALTSALRGSGIYQVPLIAEVVVSISREQVLNMLLKKSEFATDDRIEGVYIRMEDEKRRFTVGRGKVVRGDFMVGDEHWSMAPMTLNGILYEVDVDLDVG